MMMWYCYSVGYNCLLSDILASDVKLLSNSSAFVCFLQTVSILHYEGEIIFRVGSVFVAKLAQSSYGANHQHHAPPKICRCYKAQLLTTSEVSKKTGGGVEEGEGALPFWSTLLRKWNQGTALSWKRMLANAPPLLRSRSPLRRLLCFRGLLCCYIYYQLRLF